MANMDYCRFWNTREAMQDCGRHLNEALDNSDEYDSEHVQRQKLMELCARMLNDWGYTQRDGELVADVRSADDFDAEETQDD